MSRILKFIQEAGFIGRYGHPCMYDAIEIILRGMNPKSYLEIGTYEGASLFTVLKYAPTISRIVLCDFFIPQWKEGGDNSKTKSHGHAHIDVMLEKLKYTGTVEILVGDSAIEIPKIPLEPKFDFITVDGDHTTAAAMKDIANVYPLLRTGGILVFDDSERPDTIPVVDKIINGYGMKHLFTLRDTRDATSVFEKV